MPDIIFPDVVKFPTSSCILYNGWLFYLLWLGHTIVWKLGLHAVLLQKESVNTTLEIELVFAELGTLTGAFGCKLCTQNQCGYS